LRLSRLGNGGPAPVRKGYDARHGSFVMIVASRRMDGGREGNHDTVFAGPR
jgi:hypothetical protein